ncbi:MAG TPA: DMT family transporter [Polyangiaceae bacterium LLY-WYZ-15_(1-7)]|nr:hypothetical protein [Myxococcales bacterium]MAT28313.1 hypothetical protein [Sandaracinus sp.]HJL05708.1 DMT family transporter [Polyangiaceae bacterium LLY-WYZ-15_(1-7)]MBJ73005.1 hypothetical protein [Sandaracinus sp.]HJL08366.1 DMT family transporter [Polyangiaceae bacterium LLY-WYZ-15_(1-7)]
MLGEREGGPSAAGPPPDRGEDGAALGARVTRPRKGPALMLLATAMFTAMVACVKVARDEMGPLEVIVWRAVFSVPLTLLLVRKIGFRVKAKKVLALRILLGFGAMVCFFTSTRGLNLGDLSIISRLQPIVVAFLAPIALGSAEKASGKIWGLLLLGLLGCALIIGPGLQVGNVYGLWALAATMFSAGAHLAVRKLGATDDPRKVVLYFQAGACVLALGAHAGMTGELLPLPPAHLWWALGGVGLFATLGQVAMTYAYQAERASVVAAASYAAPVFGMVADVLFFDGWPTGTALLGGAIVVGAGLVLVFGKER